MTASLSDKFTEALGFACTLHRQQIRKGSSIPYMAHLLAVASIALEHGADEDEAIAALLHDSIEDQSNGDSEGLKNRIREKFGGRVLAIVEGCTDAETTPKPPWRERKEKYIAHLATATPSVLLVSASDKLHNARSILSDLRAVGAEVWGRFKGGRDGTLWYYRALVTAFEARGRSALGDELHRVVAEIELRA
jgi:(p)ppGpp synthase/HD superfamily hydrolase